MFSGSQERNKLEVFDMKNAIYCNNIDHFIILCYAPIKKNCNNNQLFASEAIGLASNELGIDTIRVLSLCGYNKELSSLDRLERIIGLENVRDSSVLNETIFVKGIEGFSNKRLKTVFADLIVMKQ